MNNIAIVWIKNYSDAKIFGLENSDKTAQGFAKAIHAKLVLEWSETKANDELFQGGKKAAVESVQLFYFSGHGENYGPLFADINHDNGIASDEEMRLGSGGLAYAVFDCCKVLSEPARWKKVFDGLHYMFGFRNIIHLSPYRGQRFAEILQNESPKPSIADAWIRASLETGGEGTPWVVLRAVPEQGTTEDETWSDKTPPAIGPRPPYAITSRTEILEEVPTLIGVLRKWVHLFQTPSPPTSDTRLADVAPRFGVSPESQPQLGRWRVSRTNGPFLEVAEASDSVWFIRRRLTAREIFQPPPGLLPSREEAIAAADEFLSQIGFQDDRTVRPTVSITEEIHERPDGPPGDRWVEARHVNYAWSLDGLPVFGSGAKIRVTFTSSEVDGFLRFWRKPLEEPHRINILSLNDAELVLRCHPIFTSVKTKLTIQSWNLGYLALPPTIEQDYLLPVYRFEGMASSPGLTQGFIRYVQAVPENVRNEFPKDSAFRLPTVL